MTKLVDNRIDAGNDIIGGIGPHVIRTDHDNRHFRMDSVDLSVLKPPKDVLGTVPSKTEIDCISTAEILIPEIVATTVNRLLFRNSTPHMSYGVAN